MRALICDSFGPVDTLRPGDWPEPQVGDGEVLIAAACAGAGMAEAIVIEGRHMVRPALPFVPGYEVAGIVRAVGTGVTRCAVGDRVWAFARRGAFAERVVCEQARVFALPDAVSFTAAAAGIGNYATALHLFDRGQLVAGETLLVLGAGGGTGLAAVEIGAVLGAHVIAAASTPEKRAAALARGAKLVVDSSVGDVREPLRHAAPQGVDVTFDPVGGDLAETSVRALRRYGRHLLVGAASGRFPVIPANLLIVKQAQAIGGMWGEEHTITTQAPNIARITQWLAQGLLAPDVGRVFPLEHGAQALGAVMARAITGKAVIAIGEPAQ